MLWRIKNPDERDVPQFSSASVALTTAQRRVDESTFVHTAGQEDFKDVLLRTKNPDDVVEVIEFIEEDVLWRTKNQDEEVLCPFSPTVHWINSSFKTQVLKIFV